MDNSTQTIYIYILSMADTIKLDLLTFLWFLSPLSQRYFNPYMTHIMRINMGLETNIICK